jgi:hypothetical protein
MPPLSARQTKDPASPLRLFIYFGNFKSGGESQLLLIIKEKPMEGNEFQGVKGTSGEQLISVSRRDERTAKLPSAAVEVGTFPPPPVGGV